MKTVDKFMIGSEQLRKIAADFCGQIELGAIGEASCFKMLPSYLPRAVGSESGRYIALDFGGTNVRALLVELQQSGSTQVLYSKSRKIPSLLMNSRSDAQQLFAFIAALVAELVEDEREYSLAHTFSFPVRQTDVNCGVLVEWAKEFATAGVVERDVNQLLATALMELKLSNIKPVALLNDTVATLLAASYKDAHTVIGSICGTGHNTAFFEQRTNMVINLESGNFNLLPLNEYDLVLDAASSNPGKQCLEKMVAGRYLGELFRLASARADFPEKYSLDSELLSEIILGRRAEFSERERELAIAIVQRAAALVGTSYVGVLMYLQLIGSKCSIAVDGSLYEKMPLYADIIRATVDELLGDAAQQIRIFAEHSGSSVGAAVAAALVVQNQVD